VIGDNAALRSGDATGGASDRIGGASGNDVVVGDSYARGGTAIGGGNDDNNSGPGKDLAVGDSYSARGRAIGGGNDKLHAADGGGGGDKCARRRCNDVFYGDSYAASCGRKHNRKAIRCQIRRTLGGGFDLLSGDKGSDS
jgi:hypothetical protein